MNDSKEYMKLYMRKYRKLKQKIVKKAQKKWRDKNQNYPMDYYYERSKQDRLKSTRKYQSKNKEKILDYKRGWRKLNPEYSRLYKAQRRKIDINFRVLEGLRNRIYTLLKKNIKSKKTPHLLGCSVKELKQYLQKQFKKGMTWNNWGTGWDGKGYQEWHIDHIRPCVLFDLSKPEEQQNCFHYTNLQPLWAKENLIKSSGGI